MTKKRVQARGMTLPELMVVVALVAVLSMLAAPALSAALEASRLRAVAQGLLYGLHYGRSEAIKRGGRVVLCKSGDGNNCANLGGWEQGWLVFHDVNNNALRDSNEPVLLHEQGPGPAYRISGNLKIQSYVSYTPLGNISMTNGAIQAGTLTICRAGAGASEGRQIVISNSGRARIQKAQLPSCA